MQYRMGADPDRMYAAVNIVGDEGGDSILAHIVLRRDPRKVGGATKGVRARIGQVG